MYVGVVIKDPEQLRACQNLVQHLGIIGLDVKQTDNSTPDHLPPSSLPPSSLPSRGEELLLPSSIPSQGAQLLTPNNTSQCLPSQKEKTPQQCPKCPKIFNDEFHYLKHLMVNHKDTILACAFCKRLYRTQEDLKTHINSLHSRHHQKVLSGQKFESKKISKKCGECGDWFTKKNLHFHKIVRHNATPQYFCSICGKQLKNEALLNLHLTTRHSQVKQGVGLMPSPSRPPLPPSK